MFLDQLSLALLSYCCNLGHILDVFYDQSFTILQKNPPQRFCKYFKSLNILKESSSLIRTPSHPPWIFHHHTTRGHPPPNSRTLPPLIHSFPVPNIHKAHGHSCRLWGFAYLNIFWATAIWIHLCAWPCLIFLVPPIWISVSCFH